MKLKIKGPGKNGGGKVGNGAQDDSILVAFTIPVSFALIQDSLRLPPGSTTYTDATRIWALATVDLPDSASIFLAWEAFDEDLFNLIIAGDSTVITAEVIGGGENDIDSPSNDGGGDDFAAITIQMFPRPTDIERDVPAVIPTLFALGPNYPNPFRSETIIPVEVQKTAHVTLRVYDLLGREVAVLFEGLLPIGRHEVRWRPTGLSTGLYLVRLEAAGTLKNRPLVLIK